MVTSYFRGIHFSHSDFPNFYIIEFGRHSYYTCAYGNRETGKMQISKLMASLRTSPKYSAGEFDFHHIIERPHLADISSSGPMVKESYDRMPSIMIHRSEHNRYGMLLRGDGTRKMYIHPKIEENEKYEKREEAVRRMLQQQGEKKEEAKREIRNRIGILREIYQGTYEGNTLLQIIASNILDDYSKRLDMA